MNPREGIERLLFDYCDGIDRGDFESTANLFGEAGLYGLVGSGAGPAGVSHLSCQRSHLRRIATHPARRHQRGHRCARQPDKRHRTVVHHGVASGSRLRTRAGGWRHVSRSRSSGRWSVAVRRAAHDYRAHRRHEHTSQDKPVLARYEHTLKIGNGVVVAPTQGLKGLCCCVPKAPLPWQVSCMSHD